MVHPCALCNLVKYPPSVTHIMKKAYIEHSWAIVDVSGRYVTEIHPTRSEARKWQKRSSDSCHDGKFRVMKVTIVEDTSWIPVRRS